MTKITIIIPNLNQSTKLDRCLKALTSQIGDSDNIDVKVVDNGSTDESLDIIQKYGVECLRFNEKQSPYAARNYGIKMTNSKIICLMDSKCLPSENYISEIKSQAIKTNWDIIGGQFFYIGLQENSSVAEIAYAMLFLKTNPKYFSGRVSALTGNMMVKKEVFEAIGYFDERRAGGDVEFVNRAYQNDMEVIFNENLLASYEPQHKTEVIKSIIRNKKYGLGKLKISSLKPPGLTYFNSRLSELNLEINLFKKVSLYFFIWRLRFIRYFTRTIK